MWTPLIDSLWNNIRQGLLELEFKVCLKNTKLNLTLIFSRKLVGLCATIVDFGLFSGNGGGGCKSRAQFFYKIDGITSLNQAVRN